MFGLGYQELLIILLIVLLVFGGKKIPEVARGLGRGIREFKRARDDLSDALRQEEISTKRAEKEPLPPPEQDKPDDTKADAPPKRPMTND
jgi:TatA/E family protein of Tat protein translocase